MEKEDKIAQLLVEYDYQSIPLDDETIRKFYNQDLFFLASPSPSDFEFRVAQSRVSKLIISPDYSVHLELLFMYAQLKHYNKCLYAYQYLKEVESMPECVDGDLGHEYYYDQLYHYFSIDPDGGYFVHCDESDDIVGHCAELGDPVTFFPAEVKTFDPCVFDRYMESEEKYQCFLETDSPDVIDIGFPKVNCETSIQDTKSIQDVIDVNSPFKFSKILTSNFVEDFCIEDGLFTSIVRSTFDHINLAYSQRRKAVEEGFIYWIKFLSNVREIYSLLEESFNQCFPLRYLLCSMSELRLLRIDLIRRFYPV